MNPVARRTLISGIQTAYALSLSSGAHRFSRQCRRVEQVQTDRLNAILQHNKATDYGRQYGFATVDSVQGYQDKVPVVDYDVLSGWVEAIAQGQQNVLTGDQVLMLEKTSGSTRANKLIPYTQGLLNEFSAATYAWQWDLYRHFPGLLSKRSYWSISPSTRDQQFTSGGVPIGFEDDTEYFNPIMRWALSQCLAVDASVKHLKDMDEWRLQTSLQLLQCEDLGLISVWSPTFMISLLQFIAANVTALQRHLPARHSAHERLARAADQDSLNAELLWPNLQLLSCWNDGVSEQFMAQLRQHFPSACIQGKGLLATEGVVSVPMLDYPTRQDPWQTGHGAVAAVASHFLEFIDVQSPDAPLQLVHQLQAGKQYSPVITTSGGLYRYHLKDVVICKGHYHGAPLLEFVGKYDAVTDVCGEKLNASVVASHLQALQAELSIRADFMLLAPRQGVPSQYVLYVESGASNAALRTLAERLEFRLLESHHYRYARDLNQLLPLTWQRVEHGWQTYQQGLLGLGVRLGDIKPGCLDNRCDWFDRFQPATIQASQEAIV